MNQIKTFEISLPLGEKDYLFLKDYIDNPAVAISNDIRDAFYMYKSHFSEFDDNIILDKNDYSKFISKLKEKKFIEQFDKEFKDFKSDKFYSILENCLKKENILFDLNYDTSEKQTKMIDNIVTGIFNKYFEDDIPHYLIRAYIIGRAISYKEKYKPNKASISEGTLSDKASMIARENDLSFDVAQRIDVALDYSHTTIKCLTKKQLVKLRNIIIEEDLINNLPTYKLIDKIYDIIPNNDVFLLNVDWSSVLHNEINFIANEARLRSKPSNSYVVCLSFKGCCENCSKDIVGKVFQISQAPQIPYEKCSSDICLCNLLPFNPDYQYVSQDGQTKLKLDNEKEWKLWYLNNISLENTT